MGFFLVLKAEVVRSLIIMRRYWFATLTGLIVGYGFLMTIIVGLMGGSSEDNKPDAPSRRDAIVGRMLNAPQDATSAGEEAKVADPEAAVQSALGFVIGMFAFGIVGLFSQGLQGMARTGELEQLCTSPHGLVTNFLARSFVNAVTSILTSSILLWLVTVSVKGQLHADAFPTLLLLALTYFNLIGFGFMVGGLVLVFKQTGQVANMIRIALLAIAIAATPDMKNWMPLLRWGAHALPITDAAVCLKYVLIRGQMGDDGRFLSVFAHESFLFLIINCLFWTFLGIAVFRMMETWSRDKGTLGAY